MRLLERIERLEREIAQLEEKVDAIKARQADGKEAGSDVDPASARKPAGRAKKTAK